MYFYEFRDAAKKHFKVCECLYEKCDKNCLNEWIIQEEICYLLGYVIEMGLKYIKLKQIGENEIERLDFDNRNQIRDFFSARGESINFFTHRLDDLINLINQIDVNIEPLEDLKEYFIDKWNVNIRYHCNENRYASFRENLNIIYGKVKDFLEYCYAI